MKIVKNKKGFSLVELLVVILITAVIGGLGITVGINVRKKTLQSQYENVKLRIEDAAIKYASDTQIITVSVGKLIEEGYLTADDEEAIYNPVDNSNLNCKIVEVSLDNGSYSAELTNNGELEGDTCSEYDVSVANLINIACYSENNDAAELKKCENTLANTNNKWYSGSVKLSLNDSVTKEVSDYRWQGLTGESSNDDNIIVTTDSVKSTTFSLSLTYSDGTSETSSSILQIDNQKPIILDIVKDDEWTNKAKEVVINASDYDGSGVSGYYVGTSNTCNGDFGTSKTFTLEEGTYYACVKDSAGNVSDVSSFEVVNIDKNSPVASATSSKYYTTYSENKSNGFNYYSELSRKVVYKDNQSGVSKVLYCYTDQSTCTPSENATIVVGNETEAVLSYPSNKNATRVCTKAIDSVGNESSTYCDDAFLVDKTNPTNVSISHNQSNSSYVKVSASDAESGINKYVCRYGTSSSSLSGSVNANSSGICDLGVLSSGRTYYVRVDAYNNANLMTSSSTINFSAQVKMSDAYTEICGSSSYCNSPLYISYGGKKFVVYRNNGGYKAVYDGVYTSNYYLQNGCCNNGHCTYSGAQFTNGLTSSYLNGTFLSSLSNYSSKLNYATWYTGLSSNVYSRSASAYVGLMDYDEIQSTKYKSWVHSGTGGSYFWLLTPSTSSAYVYNYIASCSGSNCSLSTKVVNESSGVRPVIVLNGSVVFTSGDGSSSNPYVV